MRNQPKYNLFKNTGYALSGLKDIVKNERSFQIELICIVILIPIIFIIEQPLTCKIIMFLSLMGVLIAEIINSAIERVVDLVTLEHNEMAGRAKDIGSAIVLFSIITSFITWIIILLH